MLIDFRVKNWMSYRDEADLSLVATPERQYASTLTKVPGYRSKKVVPATAIYGGNASGKTNIINALAALKQMVIMPVEINDLTPIQPFKLDKSFSGLPTEFDLTFMTGNTVYRLIVEATKEQVSYECLEKLRENKPEINVYEVGLNPEGNKCFLRDETTLSDMERAKFVLAGTRPNQMFLNNAIQQNFVELEPVYRWFNEALSFVGVESQATVFASFCTERDGFLEYAADMLKHLDTGIIGLVPQSVDAELYSSDKIFSREVSQLSENQLLVRVGSAQGDYGFDMLTARYIDGKPQVDRLCTQHKDSDGNPVTFQLYEESSGTQRLMQILPMLFDFEHGNTESNELVYIVDELDRSFHTMLTAYLIKRFLASCGSGSRKQMIFTMHDLLLMDQKLMRRDEMYITQRMTDGHSELIGLPEYIGIRNDKDLIKSYLEGRFGGLPMVPEVGAFNE